MVKFKNPFVFLTMVFCTFFVTANHGGTHYVGSYVGGGPSDQQAVFIRDCNKFRAQFTATVGPHTYYNNQYYYGYRYMFETYNNSYIDYQDLAFFDGHGSRYAFDPIDGSTSMSNTGDGWGNAYLKWAGFFTCNTITTPAQDGNAWSAYRNTSKGVHVLCGFHTLSSLVDSEFAARWAQYMKGGDYIWNAWIRATNECLGPYRRYHPNLAGIVMWFDQAGNPSLDPYYDRLNAYSQKPSANAAMRYIWQY